jgi:hypothetical protein
LSLIFSTNIFGNFEIVCVWTEGLKEFYVLCLSLLIYLKIIEPTIFPCIEFKGFNRDLLSQSYLTLF